MGIRFLGDLPFGRKLILLLALPFLALAVLSYGRLVELTEQAHQMNRVYRASQLLVQINGFVHEAQRERGSSGLFLQSKGARFRKELDAFRQSTDEKRT